MLLESSLHTVTWNRAALSVIRSDDTMEAGDKGRDKTPRSSMPLENALNNLIPTFLYLCSCNYSNVQCKITFQALF